MIVDAAQAADVMVAVVEEEEGTTAEAVVVLLDVVPNALKLMLRILSGRKLPQKYKKSLGMPTFATKPKGNRGQLMLRSWHMAMFPYQMHSGLNFLLVHRVLLQHTMDFKVQAPDPQ